MKKWWKYIGVIILGSIACYFLTIALMPNVIYSGAKRKILKRPGAEINKLSVSPIIDATARAVVMPNPDFIYLTSFYDLSDGPLRLTGDMPDSTYWSVAMYHPNTVNWFVKNDMEFRLSSTSDENKNDLDISFRYSQPYASEIPDGFIHCYKEKGFLLIRVLLTDRSDENVKAYQEKLEKIKLEPA